MNKKTVAVILELIPVISAVLSYIFIFSPSDLHVARSIIAVSFLLAFLGFGFFFIGRRLAKGETIVRILGILDWLATISIIAIYALAFISIGM